MTLHVLPKEAVDGWVSQLCTTHRVFGPREHEATAQGNRFILFDETESAAQLRLDYATSLLPPKKVLLPPREPLFQFAMDGGARVAPLLPDQDAVLLGVHTCDLHAIASLDAFFGSIPADEHYLARRERATLVSIECLQPCSEDSFCKDMGTLSLPEAFDLHLTDLGDVYALQVGSEKGAALLEGAGAVREASAADHQLLNARMSAKWRRFPYRLRMDVAELPSLLATSYRSEIWRSLGEKCLSCGACTIVCPTCTCFTVADEMDLSLTAGERRRRWDSCQLSHFAAVAGGHDFRAGQAARLRHRFSRKYRYQTQATGLAGCVGCGRCATACLANIKPIAVLNSLYEKKAAPAEPCPEVSS